MRTRDPHRLGEGVLNRMVRILAERDIDPAVSTEPAEEPAAAPAADSSSAGLPPRYRNATADHPQVIAWVREVVRHAVAPNTGARRQVATGPSLLMAGVVGAGKTHQAYGAIRALRQAGIGVRWRATTAADLYADLRPRPGADSERELAAVSRCPLLLLDDLGAAKPSEWVEEVTYRLINRRYNLMLPTLVTTNLAIKDLRACLGDRVTSRLAQMTTRVEFEPVDRRRLRPA
ncbi:ATP-binding protein [Streptomyces specialis]|uniref:ATP-binding protein n=1 Tax=Streptomyces specialis TaxID=498367 RepID=UPI00073F4FDB|nr:ATP-binding protein [Streptomyces specialis]